MKPTEKTPLADLERIAARLTGTAPLSWRLREDGALVVIAAPEGRKLIFTPREVQAARKLMESA